MSEKNNSKFGKIITKLKSVKHIELIIAVVVIAVLVIVFSQLFSPKTNTQKTNEQTVTTETANAELARILSQIEGVGETSVLITYKTSAEKITADTVTTITNSSNSGGNNTSTSNVTKSPIIINNNGTSQPYILKEIAPLVQGVIVVAKGANSPVIKLAIMRAVQTAMQVDASCIEIFSKK